MATYWSDMARRKTAVYRIYDAEESLLYVGISMSLEGRLAKHRMRGWWKDVADITVQWFPDRTSALAAERAAIRSEKPVHNVARPSPVVQWREIS